MPDEELKPYLPIAPRALGCGSIQIPEVPRPEWPIQKQQIGQFLSTQLILKFNPKEKVKEDEKVYSPIVSPAAHRAGLAGRSVGLLANNIASKHGIIKHLNKSGQSKRRRSHVVHRRRLGNAAVRISYRCSRVVRQSYSDTFKLRDSQWWGIRQPRADHIF